MLSSVIIRLSGRFRMAGFRTVIVP